MFFDQAQLSFLKLSIFIVIIPALTACSSIPEYSQLTFEQVRETEKVLLRDSSNTLGLALSGGGTRSASFNIGLLAGLNNTNQLDQIDYISTVSGGSYAAYWYYSKLYYLKDSGGDTEKDLFRLCFSNSDLLEDGDAECVSADNSYRFQRHLQNNSLILKKHSMMLGDDNKTHWGHFVPITLRSIYEPPISNTLEFFGLDNNIYSARNYYKDGIERTYGLYPNESNIKGLMSGEFVGNDDSLHRANEHKYRAEFLSITSLTERLYSSTNEKKPPIWIINTTTAPTNSFRMSRLYSDPYVNEPFRDAIYEITPFSLGSGLTGYISTEEAVNMKCSYMSEDDSCLRSLSDYVALSGAAVDLTPYTSGLGTLGMSLMGVWGLELGDYSINPNDFNHPAYLSDGGHSDNLGAYSLIKRGVDRIIISDAEADPNGQVGGLKRLAKQLKKEGKSIIFYYIDNGSYIPIDELNHCLSDAKASCLNIAYDNDNPSKEVKDWELAPVISAEVRTDDGNKVSELLYVKLRALDKYMLIANEEKQYPKATIEILEKERDEKTFPHVSTVDVNFSPTQYYAYFSLGRFYGNQLKRFLDNKKVNQNIAMH